MPVACEEDDMPVFETTDELITEITSDVEDTFGEAFPGKFDIVEPFGRSLPIGDGDATAVPWVWHGTHTGVFADIRPTGFDVEITGVTLVRREGGQVVYHRIVDWHTLYRQMGFMMVCRRPRTPETDEVDTIDLPG
jgi:hypothetical protein